MRSLLIPAGLIACGLLAALPFRRSAESPTVGGTAPSHAEAIGLPDTVTPLREAPLAAVRSPSTDGRSLPHGRFASVSVPSANPYSPVLDGLPSSYQEVAIPLALPTDPNNLLDTTPAYGPEQSGEFRRFGIPVSALPGAPLEAAAELDSEQLAGSAWQPASPIPRTEGTSALASVLEPQPESKPEAVAVAKPASPFQTVSESRTAAPQPAPRERMFIREPR